jgi:phosphosulfolactate synthase (CoM biosynthesis protein A)
MDEIHKLSVEARLRYIDKQVDEYRATMLEIMQGGVEILEGLEVLHKEKSEIIEKFLKQA